MSVTLVCANGHRWAGESPADGRCPTCGCPALDGVQTTDGTPVREVSSRLPDIPGYEVMAELGRGGMGVVYQARHRTTRRLVAVKLLREGLDDPPLVARFRAEAEALAKLQHPNVVRLLEAGQH